jgi:hypothetical protein
MANLKVVFQNSGNNEVEFKTTPDNLIYLYGESININTLIPNGDGIGTTDWIINSGGLFEPNLANWWHPITFYNPI